MIDQRKMKEEEERSGEQVMKREESRRESAAKKRNSIQRYYHLRVAVCKCCPLSEDQLMTFKQSRSKAGAVELAQK